MPTILLQEIRDFLYTMLTALKAVIDHIDSTLDDISVSPSAKANIGFEKHKAKDII